MITGVHEDKHDNNNTSIHNQENTHDNEQTTPEEENDEVNRHVTIEDINITSEMNASNREEENTEDDETDRSQNK